MSSKRMLDDRSARLFHIIAPSASAIIDHFVRLNEDNSVIGIWMAAERVLEAGLIKATYLLSRPHTTPTTGDHRLGPKAYMSPILKGSTLLGSFTGRWKSGSAYINAWETFGDFIWNMV